jgi:predicted GH43/DUF377 family glycosyl hydrolase
MFVMSLPGVSTDASPRQWTAKEAWDWYRKQPWLVGFNFVPSTACNTTEWWQEETFDPATMDRELGWAHDLGFNTTRVFIQYLVWKHNPEGFKKRFEDFLTLANKHGISVMPVLFDDCAFGDPMQYDPYVGKQREPIRGMILPSWTPSPGRKLGNDPAERCRLKKYVQDMIATFGKDRRVIAWDLYNEPMNVAGVGKRALLEEIMAWAGEVRPDQPLTVGLWNANDEINRTMIARSDVISFHCYGNSAQVWDRIAELKKHGRPLLCTEWMARLLGSRWETDLPLFKAEGVGCYNWGLVNGRTQAQFSWRNKRGDSEPSVWFHDLFHADGRPYAPAEHEAIRRTAADKRLEWSARDFRQVQTAAPGSKPPKMLYGDSTRHGRPFAKDPSVIRFGQRYRMYYSMAPSTNTSLPKGWAIGIAESHDLVNWKKVGEILPEQECEKNGIVNGRIILLDGLLHLFYNTYGNGPKDALCHATSTDGLHFTRNPTNPVWRPSGDWNNGRAIDVDVVEDGGRLLMYYATRDPAGKIQMLHAVAADRKSRFGRDDWQSACDGPILKPELSWETKCIEAPSVIRRSDTLYLFYGGGYNNDPQQIGCAVSKDGVHFRRLFRQPLVPNGQPGDWNSSETGHPGVFQDTGGRTYLFVQGNNDKGRTWFLSCYEIGWENGLPVVRWDSSQFPMKRPGPAAHSEGRLGFSAGWTCWRGTGPRGGGLHYSRQPGASVTIDFDGTSVALIYKAGPDCGIGRVLIDGQVGRSFELDTYSATVEWNRRTTVADDLSAGPHTIAVEVTGKKNPKSNDTYIQIVDLESR